MKLRARITKNREPNRMYCCITDQITPMENIFVQMSVSSQASWAMKRAWSLAAKEVKEKKRARNNVVVDAEVYTVV